MVVYRFDADALDGRKESDADEHGALDVSFGVAEH